jgi:hypothetical protein
MAFGFRGKVLIAIILVALSSAIAAYGYLYVHPWHYSYTGDGAFTDNGITASSYRYVLKLDKYDLANSVGKKHRYVVGALPQNDMRLALRLILTEGESRELIDRLRIRTAVSEVGETRPYYYYEGRLYSHDAGFTPTSYRHSSTETVLVFYSPEPFTQPITLFGRPTGLHQRGERKVEFELLDSVDKALRNKQAELIIFGGGWK